MNKLTTIAIALGFLVSSCGDAKKSDKEMTHDEMHEAGMEHHDHDHDMNHNHDDNHEHDHEHNADHNHDMESSDSEAMLDIPVGAKVYFANLTDGQKVTSPLKVEFAVDGMQVEPAGELNANMGHHHVIINGGPLKRGTVVPADSVNIHYGQGQTEAELNLPKGKHTLTLQFADGYHQSYGMQMSQTIKIEVE